MTWNFTATGEGAEEAFSSFCALADQHLGEWPITHQAVLSAAEALVGVFPEDSVKSVRAWGHFNEDGSGHATVDVNA